MGRVYFTAVVSVVAAVVSASVEIAESVTAVSTTVVSTGAADSEVEFPPQDVKNPVATIAMAKSTFFILMIWF